MASRLPLLSSSTPFFLQYSIPPHLPKSLTPLHSTKPNHSLCKASSPPPARRRSANYMPNIWDHHLIESITTNNPPNSMQMEEGEVGRLKELKEEVRGLVMDKEMGIVTKLELLDDLKRLGVGYHFKEEIRGAMEGAALDGTIPSKGDLYSTSLLFRMSREHLHDISTDIFEKFRNKDGVFQHGLREDAKGLLSLYEATFYAFDRGEEALDEARIFAIDGLNALLSHGKIEDPLLKEMVVKALELPVNWAAPRLNVRWFVGIYGKKVGMDPAVLDFSILDFNMVQNIYKRELREASRWWKELGLAGKLSFCRDRVVENYLCVMGSLWEPQFSYYRERMTRIFCLIAAMDDIYDIYGTLDELRVFTEAVIRWDINAIEGLPECMKLCFIALFNTVNEIAYNHLKENGQDISPFLKKIWGDLSKAWLVEAEWYHKKEQATFSDYMNNAWVSMGWPVVCIHGYFLIQNTTKEALLILDGYPDIVRSSSMLIRMWNDLSTSKDELERGDVPKAIQCYMHEKCVSESAARVYLIGLVANTWKELNHDRCITDALLGNDFLKLVTDGTRTLRSLYHRGDGYARPDGETKNSIKSLIFEPISWRVVGINENI